MTPEQLHRWIVKPTHRDVLALPSAGGAAEVLSLAIAMQESGDLEHRRQVPVAHAMGFWQFERGGGVTGVLTHRASGSMAKDLCQRLVVPATPAAVWMALEHNDLLAAGFARLLLWTDAKALPKPVPEAEQAAWDYYIRCWRPGKPHRQRWGGRWRRAIQIVENGGS